MGTLMLPNDQEIDVPGLRSWITGDGVMCLEIHYSSDPLKDPKRKGQKWYEYETRKAGGVSTAKWRREMEIDWEIAGGQPVFPFAVDDNCPIYCRNLDHKKIIETMSCYMGFDFGTRNPSAAIVWAVDTEGVHYAVWELYKPCKNYKEMAQELRSSPYWNVLKQKKADPEIWRATKWHPRTNEATSQAALFAEEGVLFEAARKGADVSVAMRFLSDFWADPKKPKAFITDACPNLRREIKLLRWAEHTSSVVAARRNNPETIKDKDNHAFDATAYILDSRPRETKSVVSRVGKWTIDRLIKDIDKQDKDAERRRGFVRGR